MKERKIILKAYSGLPCRTETFTIDGIEAEQVWFVDNYDDGMGEPIDYGCSNRVTRKLRLEEVREQLPKSLKLTAKDIKDIQDLLVDKLVSGGCGWCV